MTNSKPKKKKKKHNIVTDWLAYAALRIATFLIYRFSVERNLKTACFLGRMLWKHYHRGRNRALENLRASFPEKDENWIHQTGKRSFEQLAMLAIDVLFTPRLVHKNNWRDYSMFKNIERAKWLMKQGGLILVTGHYGNFELIGYMMGLFGFKIYSVARPLDNKFISRYLYGVRERVGQTIIDKKGASEAIEQIAANGNSAIGFIADQDAGRKGIFVDFFGRKASTYKSIALLAITYNIPIVVGYTRRIDNRFYFETCAARYIFPEEWADKDDALKWITAEYTKAIEQFVRDDPTQYWWLHRRWKHRPKEELKATINSRQLSNIK